MKKKLITILVMALMVINTSGVKAESTDNKIKVSLTNIKEIMIDNSLDMKKLDNSLKQAKQDYEDAQNSVDDAKQAESEAEDKESSVNSDENSTPDEKSAADSALSKAKSAVDTAENNLTAKKYSLKTEKINYQQGVEKAVYQAQQNYIDYLSTLSDKNLMDDKIKTQEKELEVAKFKYDSGFISQKDYVASNEDNTDLLNQAKTLDDKEALSRTQLCTTLGIKNNDNVIFDDDITEDFKKIDQINYDNDLSDMLDNNFDIKLQKISIDKLQDQEDQADEEDDNSDDEDYTMDNAKISLKQQIKTAETNFKGQYDTLMNSYNSIKASYSKIIEKQKEYDDTQVKYDYGFISKKDVDAAKLDLDTQLATFQADKNKFYLNYLHYIQMKEGY